MAFNNATTAGEQWAAMQLQLSDLREFAADWSGNKKSREFLMEVFNVNPQRPLKWWDELVVKVEAKLIEILETQGLPPLHVFEYSVTEFSDSKNDIVTYEFKGDFEAARAWAQKRYEELTMVKSPSLSAELLNAEYLIHNLEQYGTTFFSTQMNRGIGWFVGVRINITKKEI